MSTNLEKWEHYKKILDDKFNEFIKTLDFKIPEIFYLVKPTGKIEPCTPINFTYSYKQTPHFFTKKPTKKDVEKIKKILEDTTSFEVERVYLNYSFSWGETNKAQTAISLKGILKNETFFLLKEDAEKYSEKILKEIEEKNKFYNTHKKDKDYKYGENGYKFLGWQNGWKHVYFDEDGNVTTGDESKGEKPKKTFGYTKEDYPEYGNCREQKHSLIEVSHNSRGSENTVSCPICKIYWKYDCSD